MIRTAVGVSDPPPMTEIERIKAMPRGAARAKAAHEYTERHRRAADEGQAVRDADVQYLASTIGVTATARATNLSMSRVKQLRVAGERRKP